MLRYAEDEHLKNEVQVTGKADDKDPNLWVFEDTWKLILTPKNAANVYFRFGKNGAITPAKLIPVWSTIDEPTDLGSFLGGVTPGFRFSFKIPGDNQGRSISLGIDGFDNFMPQFMVDIMGTVYFGIGGITNKFGDVPAQWKTNELEDCEKLKKDNEKEGTWANFKSQVGALYNKLKQDKLHNYAQGGWNIGFYVILTGSMKENTSGETALQR